MPGPAPPRPVVVDEEIYETIDESSPSTRRKVDVQPAAAPPVGLCVQSAVIIAPSQRDAPRPVITVASAWLVPVTDAAQLEQPTESATDHETMQLNPRAVA